MKFLQEVCALPTAPFAEGFAVRYIERFVADRPGLRLQRDRFGNLLVELPGPGHGPRWVFGAHMDHPGFVAQMMREDAMLSAWCRGGVDAEYLINQPVRFFFDDGGRRVEVAGVVLEIGEHSDEVSATIRVDAPVPPGSPGMFDLTPGQIVMDRFESRVCDDLAGVAAILAMLDALHADPPSATVAGILTRGEEEGFIGAIASAKHRTLLQSDDRVLSIEASPVQPYAPQGKGVIIRVGDRSSVFDPALTGFLTDRAEALTKTDPTFQFQRALMPGGTCEATAYAQYGHTTAAICLALGNYHNMDRARRVVAPETIDMGDWGNMVKLFIDIARTGHGYDGARPDVLRKLESRFERWARRL